MRFTESEQQASRWAELAMQRVNELGLAPTPQNFTVWYIYASGRDPALTRRIDLLLAMNQPMTEQRCAELYAAATFTDDPSDSEVREAEIDTLSKQLSRTIETAMSALDEADTDATNYGDTLEGVDSVLSSSGMADKLRQIVAKLIAQTRNMVDQTRKTNRRLQQSKREIYELRTKLADISDEATRDPLTGLANRRAFNDRLREYMKADGDTSLSMLFLDIDHFKAFNDTYGHQLGDHVLRLVAKCITDNIKGRDLGVRYGGEEFAIILPNTEMKGAVKVAEHIQSTLANKRVKRKATGETLGSVTVSIGVAQYKGGEAPESFIARADSGLYAAKRAGRNRIVTEVELAELNMAAERGAA